MGAITPPAGDVLEAAVSLTSGFALLLPSANGPHSQPGAHSRRSGNAPREEERATSCPRADSPEDGLPPLLFGGHVAFLREGVGAGRRCPPGPAPSGRGGRDEAPGRLRPAPRGVGVARRAPHKVCFLPPGEWGRARKARAGGREERGSDVRPRGAFQPRAVRPSVRPGRYAARSPGAPRPLPRRPAPSQGPRGRKSRSEKSVRGAGVGQSRAGGARTTWKVSFSRPGGGGGVVLARAIVGV